VNQAKTLTRLLACGAQASASLRASSTSASIGKPRISDRHPSGLPFDHQSSLTVSR
jgi:hypothetical protein